MCTPLSGDVQELKNQITATVNDVEPDMLSNVWEEFTCRLGVCHALEGHIEHL